MFKRVMFGVLLLVVVCSFTEAKKPSHHKSPKQIFRDWLMSDDGADESLDDVPEIESWEEYKDMTKRDCTNGHPLLMAGCINIPDPRRRRWWKQK